jgi:hypothetical protein
VHKKDADHMLGRRDKTFVCYLNWFISQASFGKNINAMMK